MHKLHLHAAAMRLLSRRDRFRYGVLFLMMLAGAIFEMLGLGIIPVFISIVSAPESIEAYPAAVEVISSIGISEARELLWAGAAALLLVFTLKNTYFTLYYYAQVRLVESTRLKLANRLFTAYMYAPYTFHMSRNTAELQKNVHAETVEIVRGIVLPFLELALGAVVTLATVILLLLYTPSSTMASLLVFVLASAAILKVMRKRLARYGVTAKRMRKEIIKSINQAFGSYVEVRVLGREGYFVRVFNERMALFTRVDAKRILAARVLPYLLEMAAVLGMLAVVLIMFRGGQTSTGEILPVLALYAAAAMRLRQSVAKVMGGFNQMQFSKAAIPNVAGDLEELRESLPTAAELQQPGESLPFREKIAIRDVSYRYPGTMSDALQGVSLEIRKGETIGLVGSSGAGKTTLVNLVLGLLRPRRGVITVDGGDISKHPRPWLDNVGYVPQTIYLLDDTVLRNVAFGVEEGEIDEERVNAVLGVAQLKDYVQSLPEGLRTVVGERGVRLSGGQRQRIGIARALYHRPGVLFMDEGTSALDNTTERLLVSMLEGMKGGMSIIYVAHRLSTVKHCDRLVFMRNGKIAAVGPYETLMKEVHDFRAMATANG